MKYLYGMAIVSIILLFGMAGTSGKASAATPTWLPSGTPTPTLHAPEATPTSQNIYLLPTPTMFAISTYSAPTHFDFTGQSAPLAYMTINAYRWINRDGVVDFVIFFAVAGLVLAYVIQMIGRGSKDN